MTADNGTRHMTSFYIETLLLHSSLAHIVAPPSSLLPQAAYTVAPPGSVHCYSPKQRTLLLPLAAYTVTPPSSIHCCSPRQLAATCSFCWPPIRAKPVLLFSHTHAHTHMHAYRQNTDTCAHTHTPQATDGHVVYEFQPACHLGIKLAGVHWWFKSRAHAAELSAGYYNTRDRDGYQPIMALLQRLQSRLSFTCVRVCVCGEEGGDGRVARKWSPSWLCCSACSRGSASRACVRVCVFGEEGGDGRVARELSPSWLCCSACSRGSAAVHVCVRVCVFGGLPLPNAHQHARATNKQMHRQMLKATSMGVNAHVTDHDMHTHTHTHTCTLEHRQGQQTL